MHQGSILLVDDEDSLRDALKLFLTARGFEVTPASGGHEALEILAETPHDLIITDLMMPGMSGDELIKAVLEKEPEFPPAVVVITAHGSVESAIKSVNTGVSAYLRKPLNMSELEAVVRMAIDRRRLARDLKRYYGELDSKVEERTRELSLLNHFSAAVNHSFNLDAILEDAVECLVRSMETDAAWIYLFEGDPPLLSMEKSRGFSMGLMKAASVIDPTGCFSGITFKHGGSFVCGDLSETGVPLRDTVASEGFRAAMHAAIKSGDRVLGSMGVASRSARTFHDSHLQLLTSFGNQIGVAIDRINLYSEQKSLARDLQKKVDQLVILNEMGNIAKVSYKLKEASTAVVSAVVQGTGFDRVSLWLLGEDGSSLSLAAASGLEDGCSCHITAGNARMSSPPAVEEGETLLLEARPCTACSGTGQSVQTVVAPLVTRNPDNKELRCWEHFHCAEKSCPAYNNSALACWMITGSCLRGEPRHHTLLDKIDKCKDCPVYRSNRRGRSIGIMCADNLPSGRPVGPDDTKLLNVYANSAAAILDNIILMERVIKNERFTDSIIFNMSSGLMVTDLAGTVRMINYAGAEILKCEREELLGRNITQLFPEAESLITTDTTPFGRELVIQTSGGAVPVGYTNSFLIEHEGRSDGVIVVFRDLSDIKKLQDQLRERDRFAAIGKVAAGVAHEIRNPLFGITAVAQILARETKDGTPQKNLIDAMLSETSRLNTLVEELLLYGRPMKVSPQPTDLHALIESVLDFHTTGIAQKSLNIVKNFQAELPLLPLDPHQMRQVFLNVLVNALDASSEGGEVRLRTTKAKDSVTVRVSDTGSGIPSQDLPKVFDLFYTTKEKGTGLGLAICRKIVEDHGGSISIQSLPGNGTTVEFVFPMQSAVNRGAT